MLTDGVAGEQASGPPDLLQVRVDAVCMCAECMCYIHILLDKGRSPPLLSTRRVSDRQDWRRREGKREKVK